MKFRIFFTLALAAPWALAARAETPGDFLKAFQAEARQRDAGFAPSAQRGAEFFRRSGGQFGGKEWSCATCHTDNPAVPGKHAITGKPIEPLAPAANGQRFSRADKVAKWFKRNCNDVVGRECTAAEKSDLLAYLLAVKS